MKIKEFDSQHMVIGHTLGEQLGLMFTFVILIGFIIAAQFIPIILIKVLFSIVAILFGLFVLGELIGRKIVIDKLAESIITERRYLSFIRRRRIITFSNVYNVVIDYEKIRYSAGGGTTGSIGKSSDAWKVSLNTHAGKLEIDHKKNREDMLYLAEGISRFMGKELIDYSAKPKSLLRRLFRE